jgi:phosphorylcholine metabolism protein LicD
MDDKEKSAGILKEAKQILDKLNIPFCLFLGTSLGAYRDKDFCEGDTDDIDIAIDISFFSLQTICDAMTENGFSIIHTFVAEDLVSPELSFVKDGVKIDLFFLSPQPEGNLSWRFYLNDDPNTYQTKLIDDRFFNQFDSVYFHGELYWVPSPIEDYLAANYGINWRTPIPRDKWVWYKDNQCPKKEDK